MENRELKRVFDQVKLSPERQEAMLEQIGRASCRERV